MFFYLAVFQFLCLILSVSSLSSDNDKNQYVVNNSRCKIPYYEPFSEEIINITKRQEYKKCSHFELLTYVVKINEVPVIRVNKSLIPNYVGSSFTTQQIYCCYQYVARLNPQKTKKPDFGFMLSNCEEFDVNQDLIVNNTNNNGVKIVCRNNENERIYENVHNPITINKFNVTRQGISNTNSKFSILIMVIDSISRNNFERTMPSTRDFLLSNNFTEFTAYNKIGDNTLPNAMALLAGLNLSQTFHQCNPRKSDMLDSCPMLWHDFKKSGYITAYVEDDADISTFNFNLAGFKNPPTDIYCKPYIEASERLNRRLNHLTKYCAGPETSAERILNLAADFAKSFKNLMPTFGLFWMNTFTHYDINGSFKMDAKVKEFFVDLNRNGVLDESFVFLLSDHGVRFGDIRSTNIGWFEERLPLFMIKTPSRFQSEFNREYRNLINNRNRLTTPYDIFVSLQHLLKLTNNDVTMKSAQGCPNCGSIFSESLSLERSCDDAGIPPLWCTCIGRLEPIERYSLLVLRLVEGILLNNTFIDAIAFSSRNNYEGKIVPMSYQLESVLHAAMSEDVDYSDDRILMVVFTTSFPNKLKLLVNAGIMDDLKTTSWIRLIRLYD